MEFLQGLHDRFAAIRNQILLMEPFPNTSKFYSLVRQEEQQQELNHSTVPIMDFSALNVSRNDGRQPSRTVQNHKRPRPVCNHCGRVGYTQQTCYKLHGYPTKTKDRTSLASSSNGPNLQVSIPGITKDQYAKLLSLLVDSPTDVSSVPTANHVGPFDEIGDWSG
ncbi:uncharacterized protein LOC113274527 [Papaver somniferum]|uniref:uncharacterized protein LOC113274527 n=1 Tax=Papaver somniferum TaxID=3469 RepID=UPI000E6F71FB|nr:uncharacterized protein LOC113274527 [Papaver somniferum]XP_026379674.1 uncharacterized protein LOC113274527 [Papaver somniferum]